MVLELTFVAMGACRVRVVYMVFIVFVGPVGCTAWHMSWHWTHGCVC